MNRYGKVEIVGVFLGEFLDVGEISTDTKLACGEPVRPSTRIEFIDCFDNCEPDLIRNNGEA